VDADSTFALAAMAWTEVKDWLPDGSEHRGGALEVRMREVVLANRNRLPPQDRALVEYWEDEAPNRRERLAQLEDVARQAPDRAYAQIRLGDFLFHHGLMLNVPDFRTRAALAFDSALALESISWEARGHLDALRFEAGDMAFIRDYLERTDTTVAFDPLRWAGGWLLEDSARIAAYDEAIDTLPGAALQSMLRYANYLVTGFPQADRAAEVLAERARVPDVVEAQFYNEQMIYQTVRGRPALVEQLGMRRYRSRQHEVDAYLLENFFPGLGAWSTLSDRADAIHASLELYDADDWWRQIMAACVMALSDAFNGRTARAEAYRDTLASLRPVDSRNCAFVLDAALADSASAPEKLEAAARIFDPSPSRYRPYDTRMSLAIAAMYEALGQPERALEFVDRRPFFVIGNRYRTSALLLEGRISLQAGDTARAIGAYRQALAFLSDPEPSAEPIATEVRETLAALLSQ
jgi:hypothetical protein